MKFRKMLFLVLGSLLLAGLFLLFRPETPPIEPGPVHVARTTPPVPRSVEFRVGAGRRIAGPAVIEARQGETLRLVVTSDRDDELHLHGYELSREIRAGEASTLEFEASRSGRFEIELHRAHVDLAVIEVRPR